MILLIDNYDSFVFNLARYFVRLGQPTRVVRNDGIDPAGVRRMRPKAIVLSPGPCTPYEAGCCLDVVRSLSTELPILGVCLGQQAIGVAFGGKLVRARQPMHGRASAVKHNGQGLFDGLPQPLMAGRYHSLVLDESALPGCLAVTARATDGTVMGVAHRRYPTVGVQFHPESILTESGHALLTNFLSLAGLIPTGCVDGMGGELVQSAGTSEARLPDVPVTF